MGRSELLSQEVFGVREGGGKEKSVLSESGCCSGSRSRKINALRVACSSKEASLLQVR